MFPLRNCKWLACALLAFPGLLCAAEVSLIGVFPGKGAVLVIDGGPPKSVMIGQQVGEVTLISVDKTGAVVEEARRRRTLSLGQHVRGAPAASARAPQVTLALDGRGHFVAAGAVNGAALVFLVDTGATLVSIPGKDARRMGLDFTKGQKGVTQTANGPAPVYRIKLDSVRLGDIELLNVDAMVLDGGGLTEPLLGMSFLDRVEMRREGQTMTLIRRF